jgi:hypothetical protein
LHNSIPGNEFLYQRRRRMSILLDMIGEFPLEKIQVEFDVFLFGVLCRKSLIWVAVKFVG